MKEVEEDEGPSWAEQIAGWCHEFDMICGTRPEHWQEGYTVWRYIRERLYETGEVFGAGDLAELGEGDWDSEDWRRDVGEPPLPAGVQVLDVGAIELAGRRLSSTVRPPFRVASGPGGTIGDEEVHEGVDEIIAAAEDDSGLLAVALEDLLVEVADPARGLPGLRAAVRAKIAWVREVDASKQRLDTR